MNESIFSYVKSYIPSDTKDAKEDYLTQLLAWCLSKVDGFAFDYCKFILSNVKEPLFQCNGNEHYHVETQVAVRGGRIDLLLKIDDNGFIFEHKIASSLSDNQIEKYINNAKYLGSGQFHTVLVTYTKLQHIQDADASLTWGEVCRFIEDDLKKYEGNNLFVLQQLSSFLKDQGLGYTEAVKPEEILGYFSSASLESKLDHLFNQLDYGRLVKECPNLYTLNTDKFVHLFTSNRWQRKGVDFFSEWFPGIFAGVLLGTSDHHLDPLDYDKGPDFVIFVETHYQKNNSDLMDRRNSIMSSKYFAELKSKLQFDHGDFDYLPGIPESPWRILVLRKSLADILFGKYTNREQVEAIYLTILDGVRLLTQDRLLEQSRLTINQN